MTERWPFRDAIQAAIDLKLQSFDGIEGSSADEMLREERIISACDQFMLTLINLDPLAFASARPSINFKGTPP